MTLQSPVDVTPATGTRRHAWILVLVVGVILFELVRRVLINTGNPNLLPSLILLGAAVIPAAFVTFIAGRRLPVDVHGGLLALVALLGGVIGVASAGTLEYDAMRRLGAASMLGVGLIEEAVKLVVPAAIVLLAGHRWRLPADGLLIGVASGAGFAALETMGYAFVTLIQSQGNVGAVEGVLLLRGLLSPAAHMAWTGLTAAALWQAAYRRWTPAAVLRFIGVFLVAALLHTLWDTVGSTLVYGVLAVISLGLLLLTAHRLAVPRARRTPLPSTVA